MAMEPKKSFLITGANSGIGYQTALALAKMGGEIILVCRNRQKGEKALKQISKETGNSILHLYIADLSSQKQIRELAKNIQASFNKIDVLINNAATAASALTYTEDSIELQFAVNYLAPFMLSNLLLPLLKAAPQGRIINTSSRGYRLAKLNFEDLYYAKNYSGLRAYNQSKLANIIFTYELARRLKDTNVTANCLYPGLVNTSFANKNTSLLHSFLWYLQRPLGISASKGALTGIYLATSDEVTGISGKYFGKCRPVESLPVTNDLEIAKKLWHVSEKLTGIKAII
jgi:NAD(P)-dependent dehydrogenase (short-subunit alcohol dehydrogenase family)